MNKSNESKLPRGSFERCRVHTSKACGQGPKGPATPKSKKERLASKGRAHKGRTRNFLGVQEVQGTTADAQKSARRRPARCVKTRRNLDLPTSMFEVTASRRRCSRLFAGRGRHPRARLSLVSIGSSSTPARQPCGRPLGSSCETSRKFFQRIPK